MRTDPVWVLVALLAMVLAVTLWRISARGHASPAGEALESRIDPNNAPWWELMALPEVGESTARQIVEYREAHADHAPVFRKPADLEAVPGIGPKTVARIAPYLRLEP